MNRVCALAVCLALIGTAGCTGSGNSVAGSALTTRPPIVSPTSAAPAAASLPPCGDPAAAASLVAGGTPPGAAEHAVTGHVVTTGFSLEGKAFLAEPPPAGYSPAVTSAEAGCALSLATEGSGYGPPAGRLALATVTIDPTGIDQPGNLPVYVHRVAWIFITDATDDESAGCSFSPASATATTPESAYSVFGIDAATGGSAFLFETSYHLCAGNDYLTPASLKVPYETVSVPWTLVSQAPDRLSAVVEASWSPCETKPSTLVSGSRDGQAYGYTRPGRLDVVVSRPFGPSCGTPRPHLVTVVPWATRRLPAVLQHGTVGIVH